MFICKECEPKFNNVWGATSSIGPCEICSKQAMCLDALDYQRKPEEEEQPHNLTGDE